VVEVGGVERTRVDKERALKFCFALQLFITLSTASPPCFLTSLELVQGPVGQGRAELHACENWSGEQGGLNWSCGKVQKREESRWANALLFVSRRRRCRRAKKWSRQKFLTAKTEKKKKKKATSRLLSSCSSSSICQRAAQSSPPALLRNRAPGDKGNQQRVRAASPPTSRRSSFVAAQNRPHQNSNPLSRFLS